MADGKRGEQAETWSEAVLEPQWALMKSAVSIQEQNVKLAWGLIEQSQKQWGAFQALARESVGAYMGLFYVPTSNSRMKIKADGDGRSLPVEN